MGKAEVKCAPGYLVCTVVVTWDDSGMSMVVHGGMLCSSSPQMHARRSWNAGQRAMTYVMVDQVLVAVERHEIEERMGGNPLAEAANGVTMEIGKLSEGTATLYQ